MFFLRDTVQTNETMTFASFLITFSPQRTDIPFTVIVETFDLTPAEARG